jgi:hypothetical protein
VHDRVRESAGLRRAKSLRIGRLLIGPRKLLLCLQIACFAVAVPLVARLSLPRLQSLLGKRPRAGEPDQAQVQEIVACVAAVLRRGAPLIRPTCLTRGLTLYHFLRRAGFDVALCFGAGYPNGEFAAHCWLVHGGEPFMEPQDPRAWFTETYRLFPGPPDAGLAREDHIA